MSQGYRMLLSNRYLTTEEKIAARLQVEAPADGILCSFSTYVLVQNRVHATSCGPFSLRGVSHVVEAYQILAVVDQEADVRAEMPN